MLRLNKIYIKIKMLTNDMKLAVISIFNETIIKKKKKCFLFLGVNFYYFKPFSRSI